MYSLRIASGIGESRIEFNVVDSHRIPKPQRKQGLAIEVKHTSVGCCLSFIENGFPLLSTLGPNRSEEGSTRNVPLAPRLRPE